MLSSSKSFLLFRIFVSKRCLYLCSHQCVQDAPPTHIIISDMGTLSRGGGGCSSSNYNYNNSTPLSLHVKTIVNCPVYSNYEVSHTASLI